VAEGEIKISVRLPPSAGQGFLRPYEIPGWTKAQVEDKAAHDKFAATPLGEKFKTAYIDEADEKRKEEAVRTGNPDADGFAIDRPENLNKLFNKFVAENFKQ
jgi:hypothetical protein